MKKKGLFICSPGLGLMDNWMPVIYELNKSKKYSFDIFFPNIKTFVKKHPKVKKEANFLSRNFLFNNFEKKT